MTRRDEFARRAQDHLRGSAELKGEVSRRCLEAILDGAELIVATFRGRGRLYLCGNGGSAADCQHMAAELVSRLTQANNRPGLPAIALTTDSSLLTGFSNDVGFEGVFERQLRALGQPGDALLAISTSGSSPNVVRALDAAKELGIRSIALTGAGGRLDGLADVVIAVPSVDTQLVQESHLAVEHILCDLVEQTMFG